MVPRRNPLSNPELDPVEQRPLVSAVHSVIDDLGGHGGMGRVWFDPNLGLVPDPNTFLPNPEPSQGLQRRETSAPGLVWLMWRMWLMWFACWASLMRWGVSNGWSVGRSQGLAVLGEGTER